MYQSQRMQALVAPLVPYAQLARLHYFDGPNIFFWSSVLGTMLAGIEIRLPYSRLLGHIAIQLLASIILHGAGSTWDDVCDRNIDAQVERTKGRPLVVGAASLQGAIIFASLQFSVLVELLRRSNRITLAIGLVGILCVLLYPFMKRFTYWPQAWLGVTIAIYTLCAYTSITGFLSKASPAALLLAGTVCWCIYYDTIYGAMDIEDDLLIGVKSTAILFGANIRPNLAVFSTGYVVSLLMIGLLLNTTLWFYVFAVLGPILHFVWQLSTVDFSRKSSCAITFRRNASQLGCLVWLGFLTAYAQIQTDD
ncbi:hypothetical protein ONZ45_g12124 [Pleurotus djamor]|nr:hypothetical protein ONZ45_g12124 [Pleurotus djamor]